jgi:hypothetical protein
LLILFSLTLLQATKTGVGSCATVLIRVSRREWGRPRGGGGKVGPEEKWGEGDLGWGKG